MFLQEFVDFNGSQLFLDNSGYDSLGTENRSTGWGFEYKFTFITLYKGRFGLHLSGLENVGPILYQLFLVASGITQINSRIG